MPPRAKTPQPKAKQAAEKKTGASPEINHVGKYRISAFVARRSFALTYFAAFLSLVAQADGLFGCGQAFPPKGNQVLAAVGKVFPPGIALQALAALGAFISGLTAVAVGPTERRPAATFAVLWALFFACVSLAPELYGSSVEDRLLLEAGIVAVFLAKRGEQVGRRLAAWLLFRAVFAPAAERLVGDCGAWRDLTALAEAYQLAPFIQQPCCWLLWMAPLEAVHALTFFKLYLDVLLPPLVVVPMRTIAMPATAMQLLGVAASAMLANQGCSLFVLLSLCLTLLDDSFHSNLLSEGLLSGWGCQPHAEEAKKTDSGKKQGAAVSNGGKDKEQEKDTDAKGEESEAAIWVFLIFLALGIIGGAFAGLSHPVLPRLTALVPMGVAAGAAGVSLLAILAAALRSRTVLLGLAGVLLCAAGLLQVSRDLGVEGHLPPPVLAAAETAERFRVVHALGAAAEPPLCPSVEGRQDIYAQAAKVVKMAEDPQGQGKVAWFDLTTRILPNGLGDVRPAWLQPYTPRLDLAIWRFAQAQKFDGTAAPDDRDKRLPAWLLRCLRALARREGGVAGLLAGPWKGLTKMMYKSDESYAKVPVPLMKLRVVRRKLLLDEDVHTNKWWNDTHVAMLQQFAGEELHAANVIDEDGHADCVPTPPALQMLPVAEAMLAVLCAALLWRLMVG